MMILSHPTKLLLWGAINKHCLASHHAFREDIITEKERARRRRRMIWGRLRGREGSSLKYLRRNCIPPCPTGRRKEARGSQREDLSLCMSGHIYRNTHTHNINKFAIVQHRSPSMVPVMVVSFLVCVTIILTPIATTASGIGIHSV